MRVKNLGKKIFFIMLLIGISSLIFAQQDVQFYAHVDKTRISLNEEIELTLTVTGTQDVGEPELPDLDGFKVLSQGSSSRFSFVNGKMSVNKSYTYILMPLKLGKLTIGPAKIRLGGKILETNPIEIEVVQSASSSTSTPTPTPQNPSGMFPWQKDITTQLSRFNIQSSCL